jgi:hypothetical protein
VSSSSGGQASRCRCCKVSHGSKGLPRSWRPGLVRAARATVACEQSATDLQVPAECRCRRLSSAETAYRIPHTAYRIPHTAYPMVAQHLPWCGLVLASDRTRQAAGDPAAVQPAQIGTLNAMLTFSSLPSSVVAAAQARQLPAWHAVQHSPHSGHIAASVSPTRLAPPDAHHGHVPGGAQPQQSATAEQTAHHAALAPAEVQHAGTVSLSSSAEAPLAFAPATSPVQAHQRWPAQPAQDSAHCRQEGEHSTRAPLAASAPARRSSWDGEAWRQEQEAIFEADMATQSQQMLSIIGTEWSAQSAQRAQELSETLAKLRDTEAQLGKVCIWWRVHAWPCFVAAEQACALSACGVAAASMSLPSRHCYTVSRGRNAASTSAPNA